MLRMKREFAGTQNQILPVFDTLLLLDRNVDLLTPLATQLTYEGLIDEIYGITNGQIMDFSLSLCLILLVLYNFMGLQILFIFEADTVCVLFETLCSVWQDMSSSLLRSLRRKNKAKPARIYLQSPRSCSWTRQRSCTPKYETKILTPSGQR